MGGHTEASGRPGAHKGARRDDEAIESEASHPKRRLGRRAIVALSVAAALIVALSTAIGIEGPHGIAAALGLASGGAPGSSSTATTTPGSVGGVTTTTAAGSAPANLENLAPQIQIAGGAAPGHGSFNAVTCPSATACLAVGADQNGAGVVSSTSNDGTSWQALSVPSGVPTLDAITCPTTADCVAVGQGAILTTADGGQSWHFQTPAPQTTLLGVACATKSLCVSVGVAPNPTGPALGRLMRSTDGGTTWSSVTLPTVEGIESVSCPAVSLCVAVGDAVLTSTDGGTTWQSHNVDGGTQGLNSVACASASYCVAVGPNPLGTEQSDAASFAVVTNDGGVTWNHLALPAGSALLHTVTCPSSTSCVAAGPNISGTYQGTPTYVTTADGGTTWASAPAPSGISDIAGLSCVRATSCLVVGRTGTTSVSSATSNGTNWSSTALAAS